MRKTHGPVNNEQYLYGYWEICKYVIGFFFLNYTVAALFVDIISRPN